jgi:hypothetical protein
MEQEIKRGPGRPKYHEAVTAQAPVVESPIEALPERPVRKPFGAMEQKLNYPARPNYHRHWFNDIPGRVPRAIEAGYSHVKDKDDKNVCRVVGVAEGGGPLSAYLMEIPEEWFQEDMAVQQRDVDEKESAIKRGELEAKPGDNRYVPSQGIKITRG